MSTGHCAWCRSCRPTDPSNRPAGGAPCGPRRLLCLVDMAVVRRAHESLHVVEHRHPRIGRWALVGKGVDRPLRQVGQECLLVDTDGLEGRLDPGRVTYGRPAGHECMSQPHPRPREPRHNRQYSAIRPLTDPPKPMPARSRCGFHRGEADDPKSCQRHDMHGRTPQAQCVDDKELHIDEVDDRGSPSRSKSHPASSQHHGR